MKSNWIVVPLAFFMAAGIVILILAAVYALMGP